MAAGGTRLARSAPTASSIARVASPVTQGEVTFSEQMRSQTKAAWDAAIGVRFFREVANDTVDDRVFARYLKIEYGFVDCAAAALGYAVAKAPSFRERRHLALGLYGLVTDQERFFCRRFRARRRAAGSAYRSAAPRPLRASARSLPRRRQSRGL